MRKKKKELREECMAAMWNMFRSSVEEEIISRLDDIDFFLVGLEESETELTENFGYDMVKYVGEEYFLEGMSDLGEFMRLNRIKIKDIMWENPCNDCISDLEEHPYERLTVYSYFNNESKIWKFDINEQISVYFENKKEPIDLDSRLAVFFAPEEIKHDEDGEREFYEADCEDE